MRASIVPALAVVVVVLAACALPARERFVMVRRSNPDPWPTRVVMVDRGGGAELLGLEVERAEGGSLVEVVLHDGRHLWVRASRVRSEDLSAGSFVLLRASGDVALRTGRLVERAGDVLVVELVEPRGAGRVVVSVGDVIARIEQPFGPAAPPAPPPPPPVDAARQVSWAHSEAWAPATVTSCGATVRVAYADGASEDVRPAELAEARVQPGERVAAFSGAYSFPATVESVQGTVARVRFEDGSDVWQEVAQLRYVERPARGDDAAPARPRFLDGLCRSVAQGRAAAGVLVRRWTLRSAGALGECGNGRAVVVGRDGARSEVGSRLVSLLAPQAGDTVRVQWRSATVYLASVERVEGTQLALRWEDGSTETLGLDTVVAHLTPARRSEPARVPPACGGPSGATPTRIIQDFPTP